MAVNLVEVPTFAVSHFGIVGENGRTPRPDALFAQVRLEVGLIGGLARPDAAFAEEAQKYVRKTGLPLGSRDRLGRVDAVTRASISPLCPVWTPGPAFRRG